MDKSTQYCANCEQPVRFFERYPNYICQDCKNLLTDEQGRKVVFYNTHPLGTGCQGYYRGSDLKELYPSEYCFIEGHKYRAQEARFGGIVVEKVANNQS